MRWVWLIVAALAVLILTPLVGANAVPVEAIWNPAAHPVATRVFWELRLPRTLLAFVVGGTLALCGMTFQALFRNALANESTLGVAAGASLGAALAVRLGLGVGLLGLSAVSVAAFVGAVLSILVVYGLTRLRRGFSGESLLLAGVALSFFFSAVVLLVQATSDLYDSFRLLRWMMGSLSTVGYDAPALVAPFALVGALAILMHRHELNLLATGEDLATSRGVPVRRVKTTLFVGTSLMVGGVVAVVGPVGFVGLIVPHVARLVVGPNHNRLIVASALAGGVFLTLCDTLARSVIAPAELPVGAITACLGGPFFLWLLLAKRS